MNIEVCVTSFEDALKAQFLGADRVEVFTELSVGGVTPSLGLIEQILTELKIPIHVLIRPRSGDFNYTSKEYDLILKDMLRFKEIGVTGLVVGITDSNHNLPLGKLKEIRSVAGSTSLTFHRAFDVVKNPLEALEQLIDVGFNTILTAGQKEHAVDGFELLKQLKSLSNGALDIMPGGGISHLNCALFTDQKFDWIHLSAKKEIPKNFKKVIELSFLKQTQYQLDDEKLKKIISHCK